MIEGFLESVDRFQVKGWAYETERPEGSIRVEIFCNGSSIGTTAANLYRDDLERAGIGDGNHGFILNLEKALSDANFAKLKAVAIGSTGTRTELPTLSRAAAKAEIRTKLEFEGSICDDRKSPVFILGAARSGTSAMTQGLLRLPRYVGEEEGHALDLLAHLSVCLDKFYDQKADELDRRTMLARIPKKYFDDAIDQIFRNLAEAYHGHANWVEKTPNSDSVYLAPRFRRIWPRAMFIFMKRRGIENIRSRQAKFSGISFESHCRDWASAMTAWRLIRDQLHGSALEVDQLYVAQQPHAASAQLGHFLGLEDIEIERLGQFFSSERPQRTGADISAVVQPSAIDWDSTTWSTFKEICDESMQAFRYGLGLDYFQAGASDEMIKFI